VEVVEEDEGCRENLENNHDPEGEKGDPGEDECQTDSAADGFG
jgi:hypothetical protein